MNTHEQEQPIPVKYYQVNARSQGDDYLVVTTAWVDRETGRVAVYGGAGSAMAGHPQHFIGQEFSAGYLKTRCHRVAPDAVPPEWKAALDRYRLPYQPDAALPKAKEPNPLAERQKSDPGLER